MVIDPEDLTVPAIRRLDALRPFGTGFEMPEVSIENPDIACIRSFSGDRHRRYILENGLEAVRFNQPDGERTLPGACIRALTGKPSVNVWMQAVRPQLILSDVVTGDSKELNRRWQRIWTASAWTTIPSDLKEKTTWN